MTNDEGRRQKAEERMTKAEMIMDNQVVAEPWAAEAESNVVREDAAEEQRVRVYDLEERMARFGEAIIDFLKQVPPGPRTDRLVDQLTGCGHEHRCQLLRSRRRSVTQGIR